MYFIGLCCAVPDRECRECKNKIKTGELRIEKTVPAWTFTSDDVYTFNFHAQCAFQELNSSKFTASPKLDSPYDISGFDDLDEHDQREIRALFTAHTKQAASNKDTPAPGIGSLIVELAKSSQSKCRACNSLIGVNDVRIGKLAKNTYFKKGPNDSDVITLWHHATCAFQKKAGKSGDSIALNIQSTQELHGFDQLPKHEQKRIQQWLRIGGYTGAPSKKTKQEDQKESKKEEQDDNEDEDEGMPALPVKKKKPAPSKKKSRKEHDSDEQEEEQQQVPAKRKRVGSNQAASGRL